MGREKKNQRPLDLNLLTPSQRKHRQLLVPLRQRVPAVGASQRQEDNLVRHLKLPVPRVKHQLHNPHHQLQQHKQQQLHTLQGQPPVGVNPPQEPKPVQHLRLPLLPLKHQLHNPPRQLLQHKHQQRLPPLGQPLHPSGVSLQLDGKPLPLLRLPVSPPNRQSPSRQPPNRQPPNPLQYLLQHKHQQLAQQGQPVPPEGASLRQEHKPVLHLRRQVSLLKCHLHNLLRQL